MNGGEGVLKAPDQRAKKNRFLLLLMDVDVRADSFRVLSLCLVQEKSRSQKDPLTGLFTYPILMAADILLFRSARWS